MNGGKSGARSPSPATSSTTAAEPSSVRSRQPSKGTGRGGGGGPSSGGRSGGGASFPPTSVGEKFGNVLARTDDYLGRFPFISKTSKKVGVRPAWLVAGSAAAFFFFFGYFNTLVSHIIGFFYPAWQSFKAIEGGCKSEVTQWLTYWTVYSFFSFLELFGDFLLHWVPLYYVFKVAFLLWMFLPQFQGATVIYNNLLRPVLIRHERLIDSWIDRFSGSGKKIYDGVVNEITNQVIAGGGGISAGGDHRLN